MRGILSLLLVLILSRTVLAQPKAYPIEVFIGSTPCDSIIRIRTGIPLQSPCDFIKWKLELVRDSMNFFIQLSYGESLPNTQLFQHGGMGLEITGHYTMRAGSVNKNVVYTLTGARLYPDLVLIRFDQNIFHFANEKEKLIVGNAGFSFILNRYQQ